MELEAHLATGRQAEVLRIVEGVVQLLEQGLDPLNEAERAQHLAGGREIVGAHEHVHVGRRAKREIPVQRLREHDALDGDRLDARVPKRADDLDQLAGQGRVAKMGCAEPTLRALHPPVGHVDPAPKPAQAFGQEREHLVQVALRPEPFPVERAAKKCEQALLVVGLEPRTRGEAEHTLLSVH